MIHLISFKKGLVTFKILQNFHARSTTETDCSSTLHAFCTHEFSSGMFLHCRSFYAQFLLIFFESLQLVEAANFRVQSVGEGHLHSL